MSETQNSRVDDSYGDPATYYRDFYEQMPCGNEAGLVARLAHSYIERPFDSSARFPAVLEVGAGGGLHLPFVRHSFHRYEMTDISEDGLRAARERLSGRTDVTFKIADAQALPHGTKSVDRVIATCVLLHLPDPETALAEWRRVTRPGGVVSIYVPNEPGALTRLGRALTTRRAARRAGFTGFDLMMAREHRNHGWGLDKMVRHTFRRDDLKVAPWPFAAGPFAFRVFTVYHARIAEQPLTRARPTA